MREMLKGMESKTLICRSAHAVAPWEPNKKTENSFIEDRPSR